MAELTARQRQCFADAFLRTMDPVKAGREIGRDDGPWLLCGRKMQEELKRQRDAMAGQLRHEDVTRRMAAIAFGRANDCVRLALAPDCDVSELDLTLLAEIRRSDKGMVEIKLADRMAALEYLAAETGGRTDPAAEFLAALGGETEET